MRVYNDYYNTKNKKQFKPNLSPKKLKLKVEEKRDPYTPLKFYTKSQWPANVNPSDKKVTVIKLPKMT